MLFPKPFILESRKKQHAQHIENKNNIPLQEQKMPASGEDQQKLLEGTQ